ncbi:neurofilament medium polypeptide-like isoform X1 [Haliotis rubra]|uniref:neurofilament medium polypeptide-like isoform X1 n=1 Tax=Haliotis rubra TaxID=36100 RepID=UPI001EE5BA96|nr:neurofilament medium polypeptide-like isoform X1 [Haliotis rubra]
MPPPTAKKGVFIAGKNKKVPDPWCLVCGVNLRLDGRSFVVLTSDDAEETRKLFVQILGVQFRSDYASVNLCSKCERSLKRINRYGGLESAKSEANILKKSLAENLKKKGQDTVEASEADKFEITDFKGTVPKPEAKRDFKKSEPLIEEEAEEWKENQDWEQEADDSENIDTNKMPFGFLKKSKKDKKDKKDKKKENEAAVDDAKPEDQQPIVDAPDADQTPAPRVFKEGTTLAAMASTIPKKPEPVKGDSKDEEYPDGGFVPSSNATPSNDTKTSQPVAQEKENPEKLTDSDETELKKLEVKDAPVKSENSPLINKNGDVKESKLQDQQPGMLCCTIL